jgi:hypothetical protein
MVIDLTDKVSFVFCIVVNYSLIKPVQDMLICNTIITFWVRILNNLCWIKHRLCSLCAKNMNCSCVIMFSSLFAPVLPWINRFKTNRKIKWPVGL